MKRLLTCCIFLLILAKQANAQEQLSLKQQAEQLFDRYEYFKSVRLYLKLADRKNPDHRLLERVSDCYRNMNRFEEAEAWYARAVIDTSASAISHYHYAGMLLHDQKFAAAKEQYRIYYKKINTEDAVTLKLNNCDSAAAWVKQPSGYVIKPPDNLNTAFAEWGLNYYGKDGFVFTSNRRTYDETIDNRTGNGWFRLFQSNAKGDNIRELFLLTDYPENTYHAGPMALNARGDTAYITITTDVPKKEIATDKATGKRGLKLYTRRLQLITAVKRNEQWVVTGGFAYNDLNNYSVGHAALSANGRVIYFTSDMPGGEGKTDIWYCEKQADGAWGKPVNCGKTINTQDEEAFPEIGGDGVLYYSSRGLPGMGGYDIYAARGEKANWSSPVNLKYPINTTADDFCLVTRDGLSGYLSSNRQNGKGDDDIYQFSYTGTPAKKTHPKAEPPQLIAGPPRSELPIPVKSKEIFAVRNIYYDLDKSNIRPDAVVELDKLLVLLTEHPTLKVSISSHTDSRASDGYNVSLSQRRSAAALAYLVKHGIAANRFTTSAHGETQLLNECADGVKCTEAQQQLNRRTEFRIVE